jgi:hypothetical protein
MSIIHRRHPEVKLIQTQVNMIQAKRLTAVDANPSGEIPPKCFQFTFAQGVIWINCANELSKAWLMRAIGDPGELWEGAEVPVVSSKDPPEEIQGACSHSRHY